jgi:hypothetical protein
MPEEVLVPLVILIVVVTSVGIILGFMFPKFLGLQSVIEKFMEAGAARNVEAAHACWFSQCATKEEIAELIESNYDLFAGYKRLTIYSTSGGGSVNIDGVSSAGFSVEGAVIYTGGKRLPFKAQLAKENGVRKIISMQIGSTEKVDIVKRLSISLGGPPGPGR